MLSIAEEEGCRVIINYMSDEEVFQFLDTVTKKLIKVSNREEAIDAICSYSESAVELLQRQKIKREMLLNYLNFEKVFASPSANKKSLIATVMAAWRRKDSEQVKLDDDDEFDEEDNLPLKTFVTKKSKSENQSDKNLVQNNQSDTGTGSSKPASPPTPATPPLEPNPLPGNHTQQGGPARTSPNTTSVSALPPQINIHVHINQNTPMGGAPQPQPHPGDGVQNVQTMGPDVHALGEKFTKWFYDNLNSFNPGIQLDMRDFGPQHFWDDVHFELEFYSPNIHTETLDGPIPVSQRLLAFTQDDRIIFNPNISHDGVFVKSSPHGLVKILVCGSIHRGNACLGIFQQAFGIIRDPRFDNNWKIKYIRLQMRTGEVTSLPKLEGDVDSQVQALVPL